MCPVTTFERWGSLHCFRVNPKCLQGDPAYAEAMVIVHGGVREERIAGLVGATGVSAVTDQ